MEIFRIGSSARILGLCLLVVLGLLFPSPSMAQETIATPGSSSSLQAAFVQQGLKVTWPNDTHESFMVVDERSGIVLSRSHDERYMHPMSAEDSAALLVYGLTGDAVVLLGKVQAMRSPSESVMGDSTMVTTGDAVRLRWFGPSDVPIWTIKDARSKSVLATVAGNTSAALMQAGVVLPSSKETTIEVSGLTRVDGKPLELVSGYSIVPPKFAASAISTNLRQGDSVPASIPQVTSSRMTYETYIPQAYINAPDLGTNFDCESGDGSDYWYSGDDRTGISYDHPRFRTKGIHEYSWKSKSTWLPRYVSPTRRYIRKDNGEMVYESERTEPHTRFVTSSRANTGTSGHGETTHSMGNPYCQAINNIDYYYTHDVYALGGYHVFGRHDRMPDHFLYRTDNKFDGVTHYSVHKTIFHHPLKDPRCLNTIYEATSCPQLEYNYAE